MAAAIDGQLWPTKPLKLAWTRKGFGSVNVTIDDRAYLMEGIA
jgi:hypothetical protein